MTTWTSGDAFEIAVGGRQDGVEEDLSRALYRVLRISAFVLAASALFVPFTMERAAPTLVIHALFFAFVAGAFYYLRSGRRRAAGATLAGGFWIVATAAVFAFGGVRSPGLFVYLPVVATAGLFWSLRAAALLATASACTVLLAAQLETLGALPASVVPVPPARLWTVFAGSLLMTAVLSLSALRRLQTTRGELLRSKALLEELSGAQLRAEHAVSELEQRLRRVERLDSVGLLAGGVAHDFNNLLTVTLNCSSALRRLVPAGSREAALVDEIESASSRAASLTKKLLPGAGHEPRVALPVCFDTVVRALVPIIERLAGPHCNLTVTSRAENATVRVDRIELEQIVLNLALNARDAMPDGGRLGIELANVELPDADGAARAFLSLLVTDEGVGMDASTLSRVFEPFFTTKGSAGGTGLGLSNVRRIVKLAGGQTRIASEPGRGTRFEVLLPCARRDKACP